MPWVRNVLVIADATVQSRELLAAMADEARQGTTRFTIVIPQPRLRAHGAPDPASHFAAAVESFALTGLTVRVLTGRSDPVIAALDHYDPRWHDTILVCTLPLGVSRWLSCGVPARIRRLTGATVRHVEAPTGPRPSVTRAGAAVTASRLGLEAPIVG